jgi:glycosyltransferase involved in cell wall biosynthesis
MRLSVIIPTIGRETLSSVIESLLAQIQNHKIYIVFDGLSSSDKFKKIQSNYIHPQVEFLSTEKNFSGAANARNIALKKAIPSSDIIAFLGDDTTPSSTWVQQTLSWHKQNPSINKAVLGRVSWVPSLQNDRLHKWLDGNVQFDFKNLDKGRKPDWRHFTTSNLSLKSKAFQKPDGTLHCFNTNFTGWGFEDGELGYQMHKSILLSIIYAPSITVLHNHPQEFPKVLQNLSNARKNAVFFQSLHPEVKLLPQGFKKLLLQLIALATYLVPKWLSQDLYWWSRTKLIWLGYTFPIQKD